MAVIEMTLYQQVINTCYENFAYLWATKEGYILTIGAGFVTGFAIGMNYFIKKSMNDMDK